MPHKFHLYLIIIFSPSLLLTAAFWKHLMEMNKSSNWKFLASRPFLICRHCRQSTLLFLIPFFPRVDPFAQHVCVDPFPRHMCVDRQASREAFQAQARAQTPLLFQSSVFRFLVSSSLNSSSRKLG